MFARFERFSIEMTRSQAASASHQGRCDDDVAELLRAPAIRCQLAKIGPDKILAELVEYGAWDDEELADDDDNAARIVWIAAGNIAEELAASSR